MSKQRIPTNKYRASKGNPMGADPDRQVGQSGKVENDTNKVGNTKPTQKNEGKRTPESRHDREAHVGSANQTQARTNAVRGQAH